MSTARGVAGAQTVAVPEILFSKISIERSPPRASRKESTKNDTWASRQFMAPARRYRVTSQRAVASCRAHGTKAPCSYVDAAFGRWPLPKFNGVFAKSELISTGCAQYEDHARRVCCTVRGMLKLSESNGLRNNLRDQASRDAFVCRRFSVALIEIARRVAGYSSSPHPSKRPPSPRSTAARTTAQ